MRLMNYLIFKNILFVMHILFNDYVVFPIKNNILSKNDSRIITDGGMELKNIYFNRRILNYLDNKFKYN